MANLIESVIGGFQFEANQLTEENAVAVSLWCGGVLVQEHDALNHDITYPGINVPTKAGMCRAQEGFWIIKRRDDDFVVVDPYTFEELYKLAADG